MKAAWIYVIIFASAGLTTTTFAQDCVPVNTPCGARDWWACKFGCISCSEEHPEELIPIFDQSFQALHPSFHIIESSTKKYNCYGYVFEQGNEIWIDLPWERNDSYEEVDIGTGPIGLFGASLFYNEGDITQELLETAHAIKYPFIGTDQVISKWGDGPLARSSLDSVKLDYGDLVTDIQEKSCGGSATQMYAQNSSPPRLRISVGEKDLNILAKESDKKAVLNYANQLEGAGVRVNAKFVNDLNAEMIDHFLSLREQGANVIVWNQPPTPGTRQLKSMASYCEVMLIAADTLNSDGALTAYKAFIYASTGSDPCLVLMNGAYDENAVLDSIEAHDPYFVILFGYPRLNNIGTNLPVFYEQDPTPDSTFAGPRTSKIMSVLGYSTAADSVHRMVGVIPARFRSEIWTYFWKRQDYCYNWPWTAGRDARKISVWTGEDYKQTYTAEMVASHRDIALRSLIEDWERTDIGTSGKNECERLQAAYGELAAGRSLVAMTATVSTNDNYGRWNLPTGPCTLPDIDSTFTYSHMLSLCCMTNQYDIPYSGGNFARDLLFTEMGGAITSVGPTRGHFHNAYGKYLSTFLDVYNEYVGHQLYLEPTIGEIHKGVLNRLRTQHPGEEQIELLAQMMLISGDPTVKVWGPFSELYVSVDGGEYENPGNLRRTQRTDASPNPFNPAITIFYDIGREGKVELSIYDVGGKLVRNLVSEGVSKGRHKAMWNGRDNDGHPAGSGVYFYKVATEDWEETKKIILLR